MVEDQPQVGAAHKTQLVDGTVAANADVRAATTSPGIRCFMSVDPFAGKLAGHSDRWNVGAISLPGPGCRSMSSGLAVPRLTLDSVGSLGRT